MGDESPGGESDSKTNNNRQPLTRGGGKLWISAAFGQQRDPWLPNGAFASGGATVPFALRHAFRVPTTFPDFAEAEPSPVAINVWSPAGILAAERV